ncbi:unnamed protein product, partial [Gongylonema pulchrum]|uniref:Cell division cycle associated 7 n=1 Tax=Gongylonema pulchrum TaxID=637853 RepID=A0A183EIC4_9BILA
GRNSNSAAETAKEVENGIRSRFTPPPRRKSSFADDCFCALKFESDDEDLCGPNLQENFKDTVVSTNVESSQAHSFKRKSVTRSITEKKSGSEAESDVDLDATIFDF